MNEGSQMNSAIPFKKLNVPETDFMYYFAKDCATHKYNGDCNRQCKDCASNIIKYGIDPQQAVMLQHAAELEIGHVLDMQHKRAMQEAELVRAKRIEWNESVEAQRRGGMAALKVVLIAIILTIPLVIHIKGCQSLTFQPVGKVDSAPQQNHRELPRPQATYIFDDLSFDEQDTAGAYHAQTLGRIYKVDMNGDGKINCIDYTIQYWQYYPKQEYLRIVWNKNPNNGFNHLFIYLFEWPVEPQGTPRRNSMDEFWGARYDPEYDRDVTDLFDQIKYADIHWSEYGR
jgi:hypothetical protein